MTRATTIKRCHAIVACALWVLWAGCAEERGYQPLAIDEDPGFDADIKTSTRADLQWKRYAAVEADLVRALALDPAQVCEEFGRDSCVTEVHLVPLGGNDPFTTGLLTPSSEPLSTTPAVIDRVLLSACGKRAQLDRDAGRKAVVFNRIDLAAETPPPDDQRVLDTVTDLYRRLLARNPHESERAMVAELALDDDGDPVEGADFAMLACFAIGSTTEFLFF